ncbi:hypothetical protein Vafri_15500, partial [Volvox africanus]
MHSQHGRALLSLLILVLVQAKTARAGSECQLVVEGVPYYNDYVLNQATLSCSGDDVEFRLGDGLLSQVSGTAIGIADKSLNDNIILSEAKDVTFTEVTFVDLSFTDRSPFTIRNCMNCTLQNVVMESLQFSSSEGGIPLNIEQGSGVTIQNAVFRDLGWGSALANVIAIRESKVTLKNVSIDNVQLMGRTNPTASVVSVSNGSLRAESNVWEDISYDTNQGQLLAIENGAVLELNGCRLTNGHDTATADSPSNVPITIDTGSRAQLSNSVLVRIKVMGGSTAVIRNASFSSLWASEPLKAPVVQFTDSFGAFHDIIFNSTSATVKQYDTVIIDIVNSTVNVTNCMFDHTSWSDSSGSTHAIESQVVGVTGGGLLRVVNTTFNAVGGCGTAIRATAASTLEMAGVSFTNIDTSQAAGDRFATVIVTDNSSFYARDSLWRNINVGNSTSAAAVYGDNNINVKLYGCSFKDITSLGSAAVLWRNLGGRVDIARCIWSNINAANALSFVYVLNGGVVTVNDTQFQGYNSTNGLGALTLLSCPLGRDGGSQAPVLLSNVTFINNTAQDTGGAMVISQCSVSITGSKFYNNSVLAPTGMGGGAVYIQGNSNITITSSEFKFNKAASGFGGGALYVRDRSTLTCRDCTFDSNLASEGIGGALNLQESSVATLESSTLVNNQASSGGAVLLNDSSLSFMSSVFFANMADKAGGAIRVPSGFLTIQDSVLNSNTAASGGAILVAESSIANTTNNDNTISMGNITASRRIFGDFGDSEQILSKLLSSNRPKPATFVHIINSVFTQNSCLDVDGATGGAIHSMKSILIQSSSFVSNTCRKGGAVALSLRNPSDYAAVVESSFRSNQGTVRGGAVSLLSNDNGNALYGIFFANSFKSNSAPSFGGAVDASSGWALDIIRNNFSDNGNPTTALAGGALYMLCKNLHTDDMTNVMLLNNTFTNNLGSSGAAVYSSNCNVTTRGDQYLSNTAFVDGGAIYAINREQRSLTRLQVLNITAKGNYAKGSGGAILLSGQSLRVTGSKFIRNTVLVAGGALLIRESSPLALLVLERKSETYYSSTEDDFLNAVVTNCTFIGNTGASGGGGIYSDRTRMAVQNSTFEENTAGDGLPNDDWTDSGGAIFATECFGLSRVLESHFNKNRASGGPGGAILAIACSLSVNTSNFDCNECSTFGGAIAIGNRLQPNSSAYTIPSLVVLYSTFTENQALLYDGGAILTKDMNMSAYLSKFTRNRAGRNGGALALLNNIGSTIRVCSFQNNSAVQYGGGAYALTNSVLIVQDSQFLSNFAILYGGALSIIGSTCVLTARTGFIGNHANARGGALQLQLPMASSSGNATASSGNDDNGTCSAQGQGNGIQTLAQDPGPCISQFLAQIKSLASLRGLELLGLSVADVLSYNATLAYEARQPYLPYVAMFSRGGALLPVPRVSGPVQLSVGMYIVPASGSVVQFALGSSLATAKWEQLQLRAQSGLNRSVATTQLYFQNRSLAVQVEGAVVQLAAGSAITQITSNMEMLPAGGILQVIGDLLLTGTQLDSYYTPAGNISALSVVLSYKGSATLPDGRRIPFNNWNRFILRAYGGRSFLLDAFTGSTYDMSGGTTTIELSNCSPLLRHFVGSIEVTPVDNLRDVSITVVQSGGSDGGGNCGSGGESSGWRFDNCTTLAPGGSRPAVSAVPGNGSIALLAQGTSLSVNSWLPYVIRYPGPDGAVRLEHVGLGASIQLGLNVSIQGPKGSVVIKPPPEVKTLLPLGMNLSGPSSMWGIGGDSATGTFAVSMVLPAGTNVDTAQINVGVIVVQDWNRYVLWSGPMGTLMYDTMAVTRTRTTSEGNGTDTTITMLTDVAVVSISRATPVVRHNGGIILPYNMDLKVENSTWILSNGTNITLSASRVALTAVLAKGCLITGTTAAVDTDWYRYLLITFQKGTFVFDTEGGKIVDGPLPEATRVSLTKASAIVVHNSFAEVLQRDVPRVTDMDVPALVLPAEGSSLVYGSGSDGGGRTLLAIYEKSDTSGRYIPWVGVKGSYLYDTKLHATFHLAPGSTLSLAGNSGLLVHESRTTVLQVETNLTATSEGLWLFSNGANMSLDGNITSLSASPTGTSRILYDNYSWNMTVSEMVFTMQAHVNGITLYDTQLEASFLLTNGSTLALSNGSWFVHGSNEFPFVNAMNLTVVGRRWVLSNSTDLDSTELDPGDGTGSTTESEFQLHVSSAELKPADGFEEVGRLCSVNLTNASYTPDPYTFDYDMARKYVDSRTASNFSHSDFYSEFARAAYGYGPEVNTSGFNASLLIPMTSIAWDSLGRPTIAVVQCTRYSAPKTSAKALDISLFQINLNIINNTAGAMGGGVYIEGGQGSVLMDKIQVENNNVTAGDGGGLAVYQSDSYRDMQLQLYVASSNFTSNNASTGFGGGIFMASDLRHQQAVFMNVTLEDNRAAAGGGLALSKNISVMLNESRIENNIAEVVGTIPPGSEGLMYGNGGAILATSCNELLITSGTSVLKNRASGRGGGLAAYSCALVTMDDTRVEFNKAQSGGGACLWNDLPVTGNPRTGDVGGSIAIVARSAIVNNLAGYNDSSSSGGTVGSDGVSSNTTADDVLEGTGGGFLVRGHVSTLFADSNFTDNNATSQGGSIFIESTCDLTNLTKFLVRHKEIPTAFTSSRLLFSGTVQSLQHPRPKGCWGTVVYLPRFFNNEAARSGGALFSSHPEALSMVCNVSSTLTLPLSMKDFTSFNESALAEQVQDAMNKTSYQVLDNRIIQNCYKEEIQRIFNRSFEQLNLTGTELSTLGISKNRAFGYGYLIAIIPSKLQVVNVSWSGNTSNVASNDATVQRRRRLLNSVSDLGSGTSAQQSYSLLDNPYLKIMPGTVFDNVTQTNRTVINYHITAYSNKPMDIPILLLDALDQIAAENTTLRQAQVRANITHYSNKCHADLLGGYEGTARNGTSVMAGMRLRAVKGDNYSVEFRVQDAMIQGTVEPLVINITVPPCSIGEVPRDDGYVCQKCDQRSFSLWQDTEDLLDCRYPNLKDITCYPCPDGAECLGGAVLVPRQGFWHSAANSTFMNACPNPQACRDGDDDAQDILVACQEWWYSLPQGFDYQGFVDSVLSGNTSSLINSAWAARSQNDAAIAAASAINLADPSLCVLWGLPYDHPASYMQKQCTEGYKGHLCAICANDDGVIRASNGDFECNECFSRSTSITIAVLGFVANVLTVLITILLTFMTDYTEEEDMGVGDLLKVFIVHMQFFVIVTRININWPPSISFITSLLSAFTGAVAKVYAPSCMLNANATPEEVAAINQLVAITSPLLTTLFVALMWMIIRVILVNIENGSWTEQKVDMRTIEEYKMDRVRRQAKKQQPKSLKENGMDGLGASTSTDSPYAAYGYEYDAYTDLRAVDLLPVSSSDQVEAGGTATINGQFTEAAVPQDGSDPLGSPMAPGEAYGNQVGVQLSSIHIGLPIQEGIVGEDAEKPGSFKEGEQNLQRQRRPSLASTDRKPSVGSREEAHLPAETALLLSPTQEAARGMPPAAIAAAGMEDKAAMPGQEEVTEEMEEERGSPNDDFFYPGVVATHGPKTMLPLPPWPNEMPAGAKAELPPPPLPPPVVPTLQSANSVPPIRDGVEESVSSGVNSSRITNPSTSAANPGSSLRPNNSTLSTSQAIVSPFGAAASGTAPRSVLAAVQLRSPSSSFQALRIHGSLDGLGQAGVISDHPRRSPTPGEVIASSSGDGANLPPVFESSPSHMISDTTSATAVGNVEGSKIPVTVQMKREFSSGRGKFANLAVRPILPDSFRETSTWHTGS